MAQLAAAVRGDRMRRVGLPGEAARRTAFGTVGFSWITEGLFAPIEGHAGAADLARLLTVAVLLLAAVEVAFLPWFGPAVVVAAVAEAGLGCLVWWRKSLAAAVALLGVALAASVFVLLQIIQVGNTVTAWALVVAQVGVWLGGRAVQCAIVFRRRSMPSDARPATPA